MYTVRTRLSNIVDGGFFTFRKTGIPEDISDDCYKTTNDRSYLGYKVNVRDLAGGASFVSHNRSIVWTSLNFVIDSSKCF